MGGGDESPGVGGVGVRTVNLLFGIWDDGGGVIDAVGGAGDVNFSTLVVGAGPGESECDRDRMRGVSGVESSVDGIATESWEVWESGAW